MTLAGEILALVPKSPARLIPVTCVSTSPFEVSIYGLEDSVPARTMSGSVFDLGDKGMAFWQPPLPPYCFTTD